MAPVVSSGMVLFGDGGFFRGLDRANGSQEIEVTIGGNLISVVSDGSRTYLVSGVLRAYSESTGNERWSKVIRGDPVGNPVLWDERMYMVTESGEIQSIDLSEEGNQEWMTDIGGISVGSPVLVGDSVYAVTSPISEDTAIVNEVDPDTGNKRGSFSIDAALKGDITVASGVAYVPTSSGLHAVGEEFGEPPTASFELGTPEPSVGDEITFDASNTSAGDNAIASFEWEFVSNGSTVQESGETVEKTFDSEGEWSVTLIVTDEAGLSDTQTSEIPVGPREVGRGEATDSSGGEEKEGIQQGETEGNLSSDSGGEGTGESEPLISTRVVDITREMAMLAGAAGVAAAGAVGFLVYRRRGTEETEEPSVEKKDEAPTPSAPSQSNESTKTCPECGAGIGDSVSYCTSCGAEVGTEDTSGDEDRGETSDEEGQEQQVAQEGEGEDYEDTSEEIDDAEVGIPKVEGTETRERAETTSDVPRGTTEEEKHNKTESVPDEESDDHPETTESVQSQCPECGESIDASSKFCVHCGTNLENTTCPECGSEVGEKDKFCTSCGVEL
jgi:plastocyanin